MRDRTDEDLWRGGAWEHPEEEKAPAPETYLPRVPRRVLRRKRKFRFPWKPVLILATVALTVALVTVGVRSILDMIDAMVPFYGWGMTPFQEEQEYSTEPPTIAKAETGTGVTVELHPDGAEPRSYTEIYDKNLPSMVSIRARTGRSSYATGTGIVLTEDGYLITNAHVVAGANSVTVTLQNNRSVDAKLVGFDADEDLAVLKVEAKGLTPAEFGDSFSLRCGDPVAAIGDPLGYRATITDGIISAVDREVEVDGITMTLLQTSAAINFGNSGGALINQYGQVVGVTTIKIVSEDGSAEGLGFAIPSQRVKYVVDALIAGRSIRPGIFGFTVQTIPEEDGGLLLLEVDASSDAWKKGLRANDVIVAVDGTPITAVEDLTRVKQRLGAGDSVTLTCRRGEEEYTAVVELIDSDRTGATRKSG